MLNDDGIVWRSRSTNTILIQQKLWPNDTEISIHMTPTTDIPKQQHLSFEKIKYVLSKILQNSVFIDHDDHQYQTFEPFSNQLIDFFEKPVDQIVGVCLLSKLNAMSLGFLHVNVIEIESWQGENLRFVISENSPEYDLLQSADIPKPWWRDSSPRFSNFSKKTLTWEELGFTLDDKDDKFKIIKGGQ